MRTLLLCKLDTTAKSTLRDIFIFIYASIFKPKGLKFGFSYEPLDVSFLRTVATFILLTMYSQNPAQSLLCTRCPINSFQKIKT